jgi:hypothetical protein
MSYADEVYQCWKNDNPLPTRRITSKKLIQYPSLSSPVYSIPDEMFDKSLSHYDRNNFARLLQQQFGQRKAIELLQRFHIGTSSRWPGACVFWYIDDKGRKRGGQIKLFSSDWHTAKNFNGKSKVDWVHSALTYRLEKAGTLQPDWLVDYNQYGECSPCLFGLWQLLTDPTDKPVAIVEAPKTAIICTVYLPDFIWLAVGALSYLNAERLTPIRGRKVMLFPDLNAYYDRVKESGHTLKGWLNRAGELRANGFDIEVSDFLEQRANDEQKRAGLDLADFLLQQPPTVTTINELQASPCAILKPDESQLERLEVAPCNTYPPEWDEILAKPFVPPVTRSMHPKAPLAFDATEQLRCIRWCVLPIDK